MTPHELVYGHEYNSIIVVSGNKIETKECADCGRSEMRPFLTDDILLAILRELKRGNEKEIYSDE